MATANQAVKVVIAVTILVVLFEPLTGIIAANSGEQSVTNAELTADTGSWTNLDGYDIVEDSVTVERHNSTSDSYETMLEGTDYEFDYDGGEVKPLSSGSIDDGDTLRVSYDYQATSGTVSIILGIVPLLVALVGVVMFADRMDL